MKKYRIFFSHVFDIANQLLTHHTPFAPHGQVDEMNGEAFTILNPRSFVGIFLDYGYQNTEKSVSLSVTFKLSSFHSFVKSSFLFSEGLLCL